MKQKTALAAVFEDGTVLVDSRIKEARDYLSVVPKGTNYKVERVKIGELTKRSLDQSALFHVWVKQLSGFMGEPSNRAKQILKINFGFPILLQNEEKGPRLQWLLKSIEWDRRTWEQKLAICERFIPVTSIMKPNELKSMMDNIKEWAMSDFNIHLKGKKD